MSNGYSLRDDATQLTPLNNFYPNTSEQLHKTVMQQRAMQDQQWAAVQGGYAAADMAYRAFAGQPLQLAGPNVQAAMMNAGGYASARGWLGGGSTSTLMQGVQQSLGGGGFSMTGIGGSLAGGYAARQMGVTMSRQLYSEVENNFFQGGAAMQHRAHGLNRGDMGMVMDQLSQRGAFAGMNIGSVEQLSAGRLHDMSRDAMLSGNEKLQREIAQMKPGDLKSTINPQTARQINQIMEDSAAALGSLRDIFGNQSMDVLMKEAERLTGMQFSGGNSAKTIRGRLDQMSTSSRLFGFNSRAFAELDFNTSAHGAMTRAQLGGGHASDYFRQSAAASPFALTGAASQHRSLQAAAQRAASEGRYLHVPSVEELAAQNAAGAANFQNYDRLALGMSFVADNMLSDEGRMRHMSLIKEMGNQTTQEASNAVQARMRDNARADLVSQGFTSEQANAMLTAQERRAGTTEGSTAMMRGLRNDTNTALGRAAVTQETRSRQGKQIDYFRKQSGIGDEYADVVNTLQTTFSGEQREKIAKALASGDIEGLQMMALKDSEMSSLLRESGKNPAAFFSQLTAGGKTLGKQLDFFNTQAATSKSLRNTVSVADERAFNRNYAAQKLADTVYGNTRGQMSLPELMTQALMGNQTVDDVMVLRAARENGGYGDQLVGGTLNKAGGLDFAAGQGEALKEMLKKQGIKLSDEEFKSLNNGAGLGALMQRLEGSGMMVTSEARDGKFHWNFGTSKMKQEVTEKLEGELADINARNMLGMSEDEYTTFQKDTKDGYLGRLRKLGDGIAADGTLTAEQQSGLAVHQRTKAVDYLFGRVGANGKTTKEDSVSRQFGKRKIDEWMSAIAEDPGSSKSQAAMKHMKDNADVLLPALEGEEKKLRDEAESSKSDRVAKEKREAADRIRDVRTTLSAGGRTFLGTMLVNNAAMLAVTEVGGQGGVDNAG